MATSSVEKIEALLDPLAAREGFELVAVEFVGGRKSPVVRVLIDREGGLDLDAICSANAWISAALDGEGSIPGIAGSFTLEVSSPGIDRPLRSLESFRRFVGETASVKTLPSAGRTTYSGVIVAVEDETVVLEVEDKHIRIPFGAISKARLKGAVDFKGKERTPDEL